MIDLKKLLDNLRVGMEVPKEFSFLAKYDKNQNSIFDKEEIETITDELIQSASLDKFKENLSEGELLDFYNKSFKDGRKATYAYQIAGLVYSWYLKITGESPDLLSEIEKREDYKNMFEPRKECVKLLIDNSLILHADEILNYNQEYFTSMFSKENIPEETIEKLLPKLKLLSKIPTFDIGNVWFEDLLNNSESLNEERVQYVIDKELYNNIESGDVGLLGLFNLSDEQFEESKKFLELDGLETKPALESLKMLLEHPDSYERALDMINNYGIKHISTMSNSDLIKCSVEDFNRTKELADKKYIVKGKVYPITLSNVFYNLLKLSDKEIEKTFEFMNMENRKQPLPLWDATTLAQYNNDSFQTFIKENPNFVINNSSHNMIGKTLTLKINEKDNNEYTFDKIDGLIETKKIDYDKETKKCIITVNNTRNRIKQEVVYENFKGMNSSDSQNPIKEVCEYYDKKGKLIKTVSSSKGIIDGLPTQTVTYPNGKTETLQFATFDSTDNTRYTERHFVSSSGVKTDYTFVQTLDGSRIIDYVITDKNGKVLMNKHNTFQQLSDNHFITSTNGHGYDITYEGKIIKIVDSKDKTKTNIIDLSNVVSDEDKEVIMEVLKIIPGSQLLMLKELPVNRLKYDKIGGAWEDNGVWKRMERTIILGKQNEFSSSEIERLRDTFIHEFGHYMDYDMDSDNAIIAGNDKVKEVFEKELNAFLNNSTSVHLWYLSHILRDSDSEKTGDANRSLYTAESKHSMRSIYFMQNFPETIAAIAEVISEREKQYSV